MTVFGYTRVSSDGQTLAAQDAQLHAAGCAKVFGETASGAKTDRAALRLEQLGFSQVSFADRRSQLAAPCSTA